MIKFSGPYLFALLCLFVLGCKSSEYRPSSSLPSQQKNGYELVWAEEFNKGDKPDTESWSYEHGFVRNEELQWYQEDNARIVNGVLTIEGRRERIQNDNYDSSGQDWRKNRKFAHYTSSSINTRDRKEFLYGIIEVRARIDTARGNWPAIWTLGVKKPWPSNGEVDIMEYYMVDKKPHILANAAWKGSTEYVKWDSEKIPFSRFLEEDPKWVEKFHIWKMDWDRHRIRLYLDDRLLNEINLSQAVNPNGFNPFHQPHYILLNLALGSNGGDPSGTNFPLEYEVDYVRVYQKND